MDTNETTVDQEVLFAPTPPLAATPCPLSSRRPQSGGSHKSIKCMPCCKRYIGNAFSSFHTLTGQIAQRHDLLKCLVLVNCAKDLLILSKCLHSQNSTGNWFVKLLQC
ncbi:hypothetical protein SETIT_1G316600v2 [Setaria italica]|uniref:Uncharacterized protein n=1 Tax=Setaria italica TaxID=4555 RepID=A0A368PRR8_SETIT|nr:uncharacterized protein LOC111256112 isoform X2 [Setaria italica]RCV08323.1 hypothetical protein SETIT_1G316600v2 [Setaria italica]